MINGNYNNYDIKPPAKGKHHAIIHIGSDKQHIKNWKCSAFVINEEIAVTAGHCIHANPEFRESKLYKETDSRITRQKKYLESELEMYKNCDTADCFLTKEDINVALETLKKQREKIEELYEDTFIVKNAYNEDTKVRARAFFKHSQRDYAFLEGNFKDFETIPVRRGFFIKKGDKLRACGYPEDYTGPICIDHIAVNNNNFFYRNIGFMVSGMSGGPVIDKFGFAVGINSRVGNGFVFMESTLGILPFGYKRR